MKPGPWWRAQNSCVDNAKLILLTDREFRNWFNLNCIANAHGGVLPSVEIVAIKLRISRLRAAQAIENLINKRLFDRRDDGSIVPHDWQEWQFRTDLTDPTNAQRQKNFRRKKQKEMQELKAIRDASVTALRNGVRNSVTDVMAKRPETETDITTTVSVEREGGPSREAGMKYVATSSELQSTKIFKR